jgi:uncharacterized membrane protein YedE/YeeE
MAALRLALGAIGVASLVACAPDSCAQDTGAATDIPGTKYGPTALGYSFLGTAVPIAVGASLGTPHSSDAAVGLPILAGFWFGPSAGHFYAGRPKRALIGIGIRTAALAGMLIGTDSNHTSDFNVNTLAVVGFLVGVGSMVADICEAPHSVRVHNDELLRGHAALTPTVVGEARALGLRVNCTF